MCRVTPTFDSNDVGPCMPYFNGLVVSHLSLELNVLHGWLAFTDGSMRIADIRIYMGEMSPVTE